MWAISCGLTASSSKAYMLISLLLTKREAGSAIHAERKRHACFLTHGAAQKTSLRDTAAITRLPGRMQWPQPTPRGKSAARPAIAQASCVSISKQSWRPVRHTNANPPGLLRHRTTRIHHTRQAAGQQTSLATRPPAMGHGHRLLQPAPSVYQWKEFQAALPAPSNSRRAILTGLPSI